MARNNQSTSNVETAAFIKGLIRDYDENFDPQSSWSYARNAVNNSVEGDLGALGNEPGNFLCGSANYTIIGRVHLFKQYWFIASTDNIESEVGLYDETSCTYKVIANDRCLNFSTLNLVLGVSKENFDCSWSVYVADGLNPDRVFNIGNPDLWPVVPYIGNNYYQGNVLWPGITWDQSCETINDCVICTNLNTVNCEQLRLNSLVNTPEVSIGLGTGGNLKNGSYLAVINYSINDQKYGDYSVPSNAQAIFNHENIAGSLEITIKGLDTEHFTEFQLIIIAINNGAVTSRMIGTYNTSQNTSIQIDTIDETLPNIPISEIPLITDIFEKSDEISQAGQYLLRIAPSSKYDFNYQPLANQIEAEWTITRYPANYYALGGNKLGYMRDEVYPFFIRWVYNTGDKSKSYHIPGRVALPGETDMLYNEGIYDGGERRFEAFNTASIIPGPVDNTPAPDGGVLIRTGRMAYWESTEIYPANQNEIWNSSNDTGISGTNDPIYDLCGKPIRHHKFPEDVIGATADYSRVITDVNGYATHIQIMGVQFKNIKPPLYRDADGAVKVVPGVVGYEILRGSRKGNKTVVAKGIINNMREYTTSTGDAGLYQNFPYNPTRAIYSGGSSGIVDPTVSLNPVGPDGSNYQVVDENAISREYYTFHSPDTSFKRPFLSTKELRLYTEVGQSDNVTGNFEEVPEHPKHKILTDLSLITSLLVGMGEAAIAMKGETILTTDGPRVLNVGLAGGLAAGSGVFQAPATPLTGAIPSPAASGTLLASNAAINTGGFLSDLLGADFINSITGVFEPTNAYYTAYAATDAGIGILGRGRGMSNKQSGFDSLPTIFKIGGGVISFFNLTSIASSKNLDLIEALLKYRQYAVRYISHGYLHVNRIGNTTVAKRTKINNAGYIDNEFNTFDSRRINNLYRSGTVALSTTGNLVNTQITDNSACSIGTNQAGITFDDPFLNFKTSAICYYAGLKIRFRNQYGQLQSIDQITLPSLHVELGGRPANTPIPDSVIQTDDVNTLFLETYSTQTLFGGDVYIGRYTEKNTFFYFYDWLYREPNGTDFNYRDKVMGPFPRYWANLGKYDLSGFVFSVAGNLLNPDQWSTPANTNNLDGFAEQGGGFGLSDFLQVSNYRFDRKNAYFYLFQSAVRDFFVESEINVDLRDWGNEPSEKHFPITSNLSELFDTSIIKSGNYFKIDNSISVSNLYTQSFSWGVMQDVNYNPVVSSLCFQYLPNRIIYSLPNTLESKKDFWRVYLANNYKDFKTRVTTVKTIGKSGALILFENDSPVLFQGTETLETDIGTKLTIGDGALFQQPMQAIVNSDEPYEYGSCQDTLSAINTPVGIFWMSQNQGKIFQMGEGLKEISGTGMRWWFSKFLPFRILQDFPDYSILDNPVAGVGCQAIYDNDDMLLYFCKKDFELRTDLPEGTTVEYAGGINFLVNGRYKIKLGDPIYFNDVSWTISYDPKNQFWVSFHDWHPDLTLPSRLNFISIKNNEFWKHNYITDLYCNYYGVDYPFTVEYKLDSGQMVDTLKTIEYMLECYVYDQDGIDRFHVLDANFDRLIVSNSEQVSGELNLVMSPKNNPFSQLNYPQINAGSIDVLYDKVEQKYRINQFWDITDDRGEFNPGVQRPIWLTDWSGYKFTLNPANLDYQKAAFERKRFRHYYNNVMFTKNRCNNLKMLMKISNNKNLNSPR